MQDRPEAEALRIAASRPFTVRVIDRDRRCADHTADLSPNRLNIHVQSGRVVAASVF